MSIQTLSSPVRPLCSVSPWEILTQPDEGGQGVCGRETAGHIGGAVGHRINDSADGTFCVCVTSD